MPRSDSGSVMATNARNGRHPRSAAASSSAASCFSRFAYSGRIMNGRYEYTMPRYIAKLVCSITIGSSITSIDRSRLLIRPLLRSRPIHAYTRSRNEVQNGSTTSSSSTLRHVRSARAMPYAIG